MMGSEAQQLHTEHCLPSLWGNEDEEGRQRAAGAWVGSFLDEVGEAAALMPGLPADGLAAGAAAAPHSPPATVNTPSPGYSWQDDERLCELPPSRRCARLCGCFLGATLVCRACHAWPPAPAAQCPRYLLLMVGMQAWRSQ